VAAQLQHLRGIKWECKAAEPLNTSKALKLRGGVRPCQYVRSAALPAPRPVVLVGVLTETKIMSASAMESSTLVVKNRFRPRHAFTTSETQGLTQRKLSFQLDSSKPGPDARPLLVQLDSSLFGVLAASRLFSSPRASLGH